MQLILHYKAKGKKPQKSQLKLQPPLAYDTSHPPSPILQLHFMTLFSFKLTYTATSVILLFFIYRACFSQDMLPLGRPCLLCSEFIIWDVTQIWRALLQFIIFLEISSMGNQTSTCSNHATSQHLEDLCSLLQMSYDSHYRLSFEPQGNCCCSPAIDQEIPLNINSVDISISEEVEETPEVKSKPVSEIKLGLDEQTTDKSHKKKECDLQKNQEPKKVQKKKQIKKVQKQLPQRAQPMIQPTFDPEDAQLLMEPQTDTAVDEIIRDQNNCKSYHKLVKNYLQDHNMSHLMEEYENKYHTRYYFVVALIFIKYHIKQDFDQDYKQIVREEIENQERKIEKKLIQKEKIQKRIKQASSSRVNIGDLREKKQKLEKQIEHIKVVMHQIENFSVRSCSTFFQGEIEESLKILYLKDDLVMRKKYYFDSALRTVQEIQAQVRKTASRNS